MSKTSLDYLVQDIYVMSNCQSAQQVEANVYVHHTFLLTGPPRLEIAILQASLLSLLSIFIK